MVDKRRFLTLLGAMILLLSAVGILWRAGLPESPDSIAGENGKLMEAPQVGALAPAFTHVTLEGQEIVLQDARGYPIILNFWATWCKPCEVEMPLLDAVHQAGVTVIGLNVGLEQENTIRQWVENAGLAFPIVIDDSERTLETQYQIRVMPTTFFVDKEGIIRHIVYGALEEDSLRKGLDSIGIKE